MLNPDAEIPKYSEIFPKPEKKKPIEEEEEKEKSIVPDFTPLPTFQFKEPPPLVELTKI